MRSGKYFWFYIFPIIAYCSAIFYYSSQPVISGPLGTPLINDKIKHIAAYFILSVLTFRAVNQTRYKKYSYIIAILFTTLYGITDEIHQFFVPGRFMSIYDMIANSLGSMIILLKKIGKHAQK